MYWKVFGNEGKCLRVYIHVQMLFYWEEMLMTIAIAVNIICVQPKMENIPDGDWYCYECVSKVSNSSSSTCIHIGLTTTMWNGWFADHNVKRLVCWPQCETAGLLTTMWNSWFADHNVKQLVCWPQCETAGLLTTMWNSWFADHNVKSQDDRSAERKFYNIMIIDCLWCPIS